jgi:hypothetical protein
MARVQRNLPWVSHPQVCIDIAHKAREKFKTWIPAFAEMTGVIWTAFVGMTTNAAFAGMTAMLQGRSHPPLGFEIARAAHTTLVAVGVSHPQVAVEIARKARDTIQSLDPRFRGDDSNVAGAEPPAITHAAEGGTTLFTEQPDEQ